jgi:hypothetical protein
VIRKLEYAKCRAVATVQPCNLKKALVALAAHTQLAGQSDFHRYRSLEDVLDLSFGQTSCTAMVATMVRKKPASCGCWGQTILVKLSSQAQKPTAVPIKLATSVIFQVVMDAPPVSTRSKSSGCSADCGRNSPRLSP